LLHIALIRLSGSRHLLRGAHHRTRRLCRRRRFFFQAEDGIRARNVTGVQTCALPILSIDPSFSIYVSLLIMLLSYKNGRKWVERSEERRVGKECRSWWWTED